MAGTRPWIRGLHGDEPARVVWEVMSLPHVSSILKSARPKTSVLARASGVYIVETKLLDDGRVSVEVCISGGRGAGSQLVARAVAGAEETARRLVEERLAETEQRRAATPLPGSLSAHAPPRPKPS